MSCCWQRTREYYDEQKAGQAVHSIRNHMPSCLYSHWLQVPGFGVAEVRSRKPDTLEVLLRCVGSLSHAQGGRDRCECGGSSQACEGRFGHGGSAGDRHWGHARRGSMHEGKHTRKRTSSQVQSASPFCQCTEHRTTICNPFHDQVLSTSSQRPHCVASLMMRLYSALTLALAQPAILGSRQRLSGLRNPSAGTCFPLHWA